MDRSNVYNTFWVEIGKGAVLAIRSVVAREVSSNTLAAGNLAKK